MNFLQPNTTLQGGKYRIERVLGQGGFGITYLAVQTSLNRKVAIKELFIGGQGQAINDRRGNMVIITNSANQTIFNQQKEKFKKEALRLANLDHPNLIKVHEFFEENGTVYYVMDYIEGESLRTKLNREGLLSENLVLKYLQQLLPALETAHKKSIWHLDIKPENIMVDHSNKVYLIDFGSSKHIEQCNGTLTTSSLLAYTPGFYPPEQSAITMKNIGAWTDIYALGATLYNLLTRRNPPTFDVIISEGLNAFSFPTSISSKTQDLIVLMMKVNRYERPQSINGLMEKLEHEHIIDRISLFERTKDVVYCDDKYIEETIVFNSKEYKGSKWLGISLNGHDAVDLGLSVLWATMDVGATPEDDCGECFLWGDPDGRKTQKVQESTWSRWFNSGPNINKISGIPQYDAATCLWGEGWKIPTRKEFEELANKCSWEIINNNYAKITGSNGNYIVLDNRWHWIGESPFGEILMFCWTCQDEIIRWNIQSLSGLEKGYTDIFLPIRPVSAI